MPERHFLHDNFQLDSFYALVKEKIEAGEAVCVQFVESKRNDSQNALFHKLCRVVSEQKSDESIDDIRRYCKLRFGVPILRAEDDDFRQLYDQSIKNSLTYEEKLEAMDILPVTSRMSVKQFTKLIDAVIVHFTEQGIDFGSLERY